MKIPIPMRALAQALITLLLCLLPLSGQAGQGETRLGPAELERLFTEALLSNSPWQRQDVRIANFSARPAELILPAGRVSHRIVQQPADGQPGRKSVVALILVNGREQQQVRMSGDLRLFGNVVHTTRRLPRGEVITADALSVQRQDISMLDASLLQDPAQAVGRQMKASVPAGALLYRQLISEPPLVGRGETVTIVAKTTHLQVSAPGLAKEAGALGETVRVKNLTSRREITAKVAGAGVVETEF